MIPLQTTGCDDETQFILIPNIYIWSTTTFVFQFKVQICIYYLMLESIIIELVEH